jgi:hypothetical protein
MAAYAIHGGSIARIIAEPVAGDALAVIVCAEMYGPLAVKVHPSSYGQVFASVEALESFYDALEV